MPEKIVLLLGHIAHEGVTSQLFTGGLCYKLKFLSSSVANWETIVRLFRTNDVTMVLGKLTGDVYDHLVSKDHESVSSELLKAIAKCPHRLFSYENLIAGKQSEEDDKIDRFWRPSVKVMQKANARLREHGLDV